VGGAVLFGGLVTLAGVGGGEEAVRDLDRGQGAITPEPSTRNRQRCEAFTIGVLEPRRYLFS